MRNVYSLPSLETMRVEYLESVRANIAANHPASASLGASILVRIARVIKRSN
jgi:hypothetical protein